MIMISIMMKDSARLFLILDPNSIKNVNYHSLSRGHSTVLVSVVAKEKNLGVPLNWMQMGHISVENGDIVTHLYVL